MEKLNRIFLTIPALLACTGVLQATSNPLVVTSSTVALTWQKAAGGAPGSPGTSVNVTASIPTAITTPAFFTVNIPSSAIWLNVSPMFATAQASTAKTGQAVLTFQASVAADTLGAGTYTATVNLTPNPALSSSYNASTPVAVTLTVKEPPASLSVAVTGSNTYTPGGSYPTFQISTVSSGDPISFTATPSVTSPTSPANWLLVSTNSTATGSSTGVNGIAYSFSGPTVYVSFLPQVLLQSSPGTQLTGKITFTSGSTVLATANISVGVTIAGATVTSVSPAVVAVNKANSNPAEIVVTGTNFTAGSTMFVATGSTTSAAQDANGTALPPSAVTYVSNTTVLVSVPSAYLGSAGYLAIDAVSPGSSSSPHPAGGLVKVTTAPIISGIVNAASYNAASTAGLAPYEIITIFGDNFCPTTQSIDVVPGTVDAQGRFPSSLNCGSDNAATTVTFSDQTGTALTQDAQAPLLLISKNQINAIVPSQVGTQSGVTGLQIAVAHNSVTGLNAALATQAYLPISTVAQADPGVFTVGSAGQGQGAILNYDNSVNSPTNQAPHASTLINGVAGNNISIYLTGLGAPTSTSPNWTGNPAPSGNGACIALADYFGAVNTAASTTWDSDDGAVFSATFLADINANAAAPCFSAITSSSAAVNNANNVSVQIGGTYATVTYAGFASGSVAGLYQINAQVPTTLTVPAANTTTGTPAGQVPVVVNVGTGSAALSNTSQTVYMYIK